MSDSVVQSVKDLADLPRRKILDAVFEEREFQDLKWGRDSILRRGIDRGFVVLSEEVGEAAKEVNEFLWAMDRERVPRDFMLSPVAPTLDQLTAVRDDAMVAGEIHLRQLESELVQVAACAVAMIEAVQVRRGKMQVLFDAARARMVARAQVAVPAPVVSDVAPAAIDGHGVGSPAAQLDGEYVGQDKPA